MAIQWLSIEDFSYLTNNNNVNKTVEIPFTSGGGIDWQSIEDESLLFLLESSVFLVKVDGVIGYFDDGNFIAAEEDLTVELFEEHGMDAFSDIPINKLGEFNEFSILFLHEKGDLYRVKVEYTPEYNLLLASGDIKLESVGNIDFFKVDATTDRDVYMIVSVDSGESWNTLVDGEWEEIPPNADVVKDKGIELNDFNNVLPEQWNELRKFSDAIRFGYCIDGDTMIHSISGQFDMTGTWTSAYHGEHYDYKYINNSTIVITLKVDGDYKLNY